MGCSGLPFDSKEDNDRFITAIIQTYKKYDSKIGTVGTISKYRASVFSAFVAESLTYLPPIERIVNGYSFTDHVLKRLLLLRKAGKLPSKNPVRVSNKGKSKRSKPGATAGSIIRKVE